MTEDPARLPGSSTPGEIEARKAITRTTITPAPGTLVSPEESQPARRLRRKSGTGEHGELGTAMPPLPGSTALRLVMATLLGLCCLITVGGATIVLLLWRQNRDSGVLRDDLDRAWDIFGTLRDVELWVALAVIPVSMAWIVLSAINVRRATGTRRNYIAAALSVPIGIAGAWYINTRLITDAQDNLARGAGFALQVVFLAIPLLAMERIVEAAEARHRPLRAAFVIGVGYLASLQFLAAIATADENTEPEDWGRLGGYLLIAALLQVLGTLSANEAARAVDEGSEHRYQLRHKFGESLLAQAQR